MLQLRLLQECRIMRTALKEFYFNCIYNPVYDYSTAQVVSYQRLQKECLDKLDFQDGEKVLCVGVGTGNEIVRIINRNNRVVIYGVDMSEKGLKRAHKKALNMDYELNVMKMDAHRLEFDDGSFDKIVCIHLMGFLDDDKRATGEIFRVLKPGGQFVITYPSGSGGISLASEIRESMSDNIKSGEYGKVVRQLLASIMAGIVYLPGAFWVRPSHGFYSYDDIKAMFETENLSEFQIEEDRRYQDFIVFGRK